MISCFPRPPCFASLCNCRFPACGMMRVACTILFPCFSSCWFLATSISMCTVVVAAAGLPRSQCPPSSVLFAYELLPLCCSPRANSRSFVYHLHKIMQPDLSLVYRCTHAAAPVRRVKQSTSPETYHRWYDRCQSMKATAVLLFTFASLSTQHMMGGTCGDGSWPILLPSSKH